MSGFDSVLMATGRLPLTAPLQLQNAGVSVTQAGHIEVDEWQQSSQKGIYAVGDACTSGHALTPVAIAAGRLLSDRLFGDDADARLRCGTKHSFNMGHSASVMLLYSSYLNGVLCLVTATRTSQVLCSATPPSALSG